MSRWVAAFASGVLIAGLGGFLAVQGLDRADKWASVLGLFVGLAGLGLAVAGVAGARRKGGGQTVTDSTVGGGITQIRGVSGTVRIGAVAAPSATPPVAPPSPVPPAGSPPDASAGGGQSVTRSSTIGPVRQVDDVGGDVEVDR